MIESILAHTAIIYILASASYLFITRSYGTPLKDSLTPEQREIKRVSSQRRMKAFVMSLIISVAVIAAYKMMM